jgi:RNA polymerase sigma-54 factor
MADQILSQSQIQTQTLILAPQLRQSLEMLQVPVLELQTLIQNEIQQNPTLEEEITDSKDRLEVESIDDKDSQDNAPDGDIDEQLDALARLDDEWREYFRQSRSATSYSADDSARRQFFLDSLSKSESLQEHLLNQLKFANLGEDDYQLGELILGSINEDGYLSTPIEELLETTGYSEEQGQKLIRVIQEFDPVGVCARDLRECLLLQLHRLSMGDSLEATIVRDHIASLGAHKFSDIARAVKETPEVVQKAAQFIGTLEPKPGRSFTSTATTYVLPEVLVHRVDGEYTIALNNEQVPHIRISNHYRKLMADPNTNTEVKTYIRDKIRAGEFLIKSIGQRQQTISRIAHEIVAVQHDFLEHGVTHLRPLTMAEIAKKLEIHETTVSRAIASKYMQTPRGTFEMKYFFTPGFKTADGKQISNKTIKDAIVQLVNGEDASNPLSDQQMVDILKDRGTKVARRTIAKYREELRILPSHLRKTL